MNVKNIRRKDLCRIGGEKLTVDTTDFNNVSYDEIVMKIKAVICEVKN